jgi:uncharacterized membrane protein
MIPLPVFGGTFNGAYAVADNGVVVGFCSVPSFGTVAVKWENGEPTILPLLGGPSSGANDVNEHGWIVGSAWLLAQPSTTASLWIDDQVFDLSRHSLIDQGDLLYAAQGVNEHGQIVGDGEFDGQYFAYVLTPLRAGDVDGNGSVGVQDLLGVINGWGACSVPHSVATCPADLDVNGTVGVPDLLRVINDWGPGD